MLSKSLVSQFMTRDIIRQGFSAVSKLKPFTESPKEMLVNPGYKMAGEESENHNLVLRVFKEQPKLLLPTFIEQPKLFLQSFSEQPKLLLPIFVEQPKLFLPMFVEQHKLLLPLIDEKPDLILPPLTESPDVLKPLLSDCPDLILPPLSKKPELFFPVLYDYPDLVLPGLHKYPRFITPLLNKDSDLVLQALSMVSKGAVETSKTSKIDPKPPEDSSKKDEKVKPSSLSKPDQLKKEKGEEDETTSPTNSILGGLVGGLIAIGGLLGGIFGGGNNDDGDKKDELWKSSKCTKEELIAYLKKMDEDNAKRKKKTTYGIEFENTDHWPDEIQIPKDSSVLTLDHRIDWSQVPEGGYVLDNQDKPIKETYVPKLGEVIDRYGSEDGTYVSPVIGGEPYSYDQRSLPFVEDSSKYAQYKTIGDFANIKKAFDDCTNETLKIKLKAFMEKRKLTFEALATQKGAIASGFGSKGGGIQYQLPLTVELLVGLNILQKI